MSLVNRCLRQLLRFAPPIVCLFLMISGTGYAQVPLRKPSAHGGTPGKTVDLTQPNRSRTGTKAYRDFVKFNPSYRSLLPKSRKCVTVEMEEDRRHEESTESVAEFEQWLDRSISQTSTRNLRKSSTTYAIPVVVHVIYGNETENISEDQILSQLTALNQDFRRTNPDKANTLREFENLAADTQIEFCLAQKSPNGGATNGINRISISGGPFTDSYINDVIKPNTIWDANRYLNIWVCNLSGGILGYAQFPTSAGITGLPTDPGGADTDGVVIHYTAFGTNGTAAAPFNKGRTATHEIGHWLGLRHIWGDGDCEVDDYVNDTPVSAGPNFMCPDNASGCTGVAMFQNYMDYTDDACMNMFTREQRVRMRAVMENGPRRRNLTRSTACQAPIQVPKPQFTADVTSGCGPLTVAFKNETPGTFKDIQWTFEGGKPNSSRKEAPVVVYKKPGIYSVKLTLSNRQGPGSTVKRRYIQVVGNAQAPPIAIDFEGSEFPVETLTQVNPELDQTWETSARVGAHGKSNGAVWFNNFNNNLVGGLDWFMLPITDLSGSVSTQLHFDVAYAPFTDERYSDSLGVFIATDCGTRFQSIYFKGGTQLSTAAPYRGNFVPQPQEWRSEAIDLSDYDGASHIRIAFVNFSGYGNDLYLDNIRLAATPTPKPIADFSTSETAICSGEGVIFTDKSTNNPEKWVWSFPGGFPASDTTDEPTVSYSEAGTYEVVLTVSNAHGSSTIRKEALVQVKAGPPLQLTASTEQLCPGNDAQLVASGADSYEWILESGEEKTDTLLTVRPQTSTTYLVAGTAENGCTAVASVSIEVGEENPLRLEPPSATICTGEEVRISAYGAGEYRWISSLDSSETEGPVLLVSPTQSTTYQLTGTTTTGCKVIREIPVTVHQKPDSLTVNLSDTTICPGEVLDFIATGADAYEWSPFLDLNTFQGAKVVARPMDSRTYTLRAFAENGCTEDRQINVQVKDAPRLEISPGEMTICEGEEVEIFARGAKHYTWTPSNTLNVDFGPQIKASPTADTRYRVIAHNDTDCIDTAYLQLNVLESPKAVASTNRPTLCPGQEAVLEAFGGVSYRWSPDIGLNKISGPEVFARPSQNRTYQVAVQGGNGCISTAEVEVDVATGGYARPGFYAEKTEICAGETISIVDYSENATAYFWTFPGGVPARSTERHPKVTYHAPGVYDVLLEVQGCEGGERTFKQEYIQVSDPAHVEVAFTDTAICVGDTLRLIASGAFAYEWKPTDDLEQSNQATVLARPLVPTLYQVTGTNQLGCTGTAEVLVALKSPAKLMEVGPTDPVFCAGGSAIIRVTGGDTIKWAPSEGLSTNIGREVFASPLETTLYTVSSIDTAGCVQQDTVTVTVHPQTTVSINADTVEICYGGTVPLIASGAGSYKWAPTDGLSASTGNEIEAFPKFSTTYLVSGTDENGCGGEAQVHVRVRIAKEFTASTSRDTICRGNSTILSVADGGDIPFYWSPSEGLDNTVGKQVTASPDVTTSYTVSSGTTQGCENSTILTVYVTESDPIEIDPPVPTICPGERISLTASGAVEYEWASAPGLNDSTGATVEVFPKTTTAYAVSGYDSLACFVSGTVSVQVKNEPTLDVAASAGSICEGDLVTLSAQGARTYTWSSDEYLPQESGSEIYVQPSQSADYRVVSEDEFGCKDTAKLAVKVTRIQPDFDLSTTTIDLAEDFGIITFEDKSPGAIAWMWDFGIRGSSMDQNPKHIFTEVGTYPVRLIVSNGVCEASVEKLVVVENSSSLEELEEENGILISQTPVEGIVNLQVQSSRKMYLRLRLIDASGNHLLSGALRIKEGAFSQQLDLNGYEKGQYFLQLTDGIETISRPILYN